MIPKILKIKGLYSYRDEQIIDFEKLTDAGVFGIFGDVGSGKSTILEAMIFCIYGRTERLKQSGENRNYNMMNLMMNESEIDFTFEAGPVRQLYNIHYKLGRNRNNFDDVSIRFDHYYKIENGSKIPIAHEEILKAVGLTYENFKMTVIIPQGKFRDFIELTNSDRSRMLKDLFRLHHFDLSGKIKILELENDSLLDLRSGELSAYQFVDENIIKEKEGLLIDSNIELKNLSTELTKLEKEVQESIELRKNILMLQEHQQMLNELKEEEFSVKQLEIELTEYSNIRNHFRELYKEELRVKSNLENEFKKREDLLEKKSKIIDTLNILKARFEEAEKLFITIDKLRSDAVEYDKMAELLDGKAEESNLLKELSVIQQSIESLDLAINNKNRDKTILIEKAEQLKKDLLPANVTALAEKWFSDKEHEEKIIQQLQEKLASLQVKFDKIQNELEGFVKDIEGFDKITSPEESSKFFENRKALVQKELSCLSERKTSLIIQQELSMHARHLEDGKPCVLCGSIHHPSPLQLIDFNSELDELDHQIQILHQKLSDESDKEKEIYSRLNSRLELDVLIRDSYSEIAEKKSHLLTQFSEFPFKEYTFKDKADFEKKGKDNAQRQATIEQMDDELKHLATAIDEISNKKIEDEKKEIKIKTSLHNLIQRLKILSAGITNLNISLYLNETAADQMKRKSDLLLKINTISEDYNSAQKLLNVKESEKASLDGSLNEVLKRISEEEPKLVETKQNIQKKLKELNFDYDHVYAILLKKLDENEINSKINDFRQKVADRLSEINILNKKIEGKIFDPEKFKGFESQLHTKKERYQFLSEQKGALENEIDHQQKSLKKKQKLQTEIDALQMRKMDISKMKNMFSGNAFVDFVSQRYLFNVVAVANRRFRKMVRQKYSLELKEGDIIIRDHMNEGKERSIKSLSGGQSFQAALSLALSLSENIQRNAGVDQHFFFLDEGFGSLDEDNLQIVFETLRALQQENRIVGLISHVKSLQQELDIYLMVSNDEQHGSLITKSWGN